MGNSVVVVEHDKDMMLEADYIVDLGPRAGRLGGQVVSGTPQEMLSRDTMTAAYLNGKQSIPVPQTRRQGNGKSIVLQGARGNNVEECNRSISFGKVHLCNRSFGER